MRAKSRRVSLRSCSVRYCVWAWRISWRWELRIPWCFVNPSLYFGEDSARPVGGGFPRRQHRHFSVLVPAIVASGRPLVLHATDAAFDVSSHFTFQVIIGMSGHCSGSRPLVSPSTPPNAWPTLGACVLEHVRPRSGKSPLRGRPSMPSGYEAVRVLVTIGAGMCQQS